MYGWASLVAQKVKRLPAMQETWVQSLGQEDPLEKEMEIHSSTLAWKIPWTKEPGRLQSMGLQRVRHDWTTSLCLYGVGSIWEFFVSIPYSQFCCEPETALKKKNKVFNSSNNSKKITMSNPHRIILIFQTRKCRNREVKWQNQDFCLNFFAFQAHGLSILSHCSDADSGLPVTSWSSPFPYSPSTSYLEPLCLSFSDGRNVHGPFAR